MRGSSKSLPWTDVVLFQPLCEIINNLSYFVKGFLLQEVVIAPFSLLVRSSEEILLLSQPVPLLIINAWNCGYMHVCTQQILIIKVLTVVF